MKSLLASLALSAVLLTTPAYAYTPTEMAAAQACLTMMGYTPGPVDGQYGPQTDLSFRVWAMRTFGPGYAHVPIDTTLAHFLADCETAGKSYQAAQLKKYSR
jgi:hypothetical protein